MGRPRKPWFRESDGWWVSRFTGRYEKLARGKENKREALVRFYQLSAAQEAARPAEAGRHTVASVIEHYLRFAKSRYSDRSLYERKIILQDFAEAHGRREVNDRDCLPLHLTSWVD